MNLENLELVKMRENVFDNYRAAISKTKEIQSTIDATRKQLENLQKDYHSAVKSIETLKSLIEVMITEDLDPTTAKLTYTDGFGEFYKKYRFIEFDYTQKSANTYSLSTVVTGMSASVNPYPYSTGAQGSVSSTSSYPYVTTGLINNAPWSYKDNTGNCIEEDEP